MFWRVATRTTTFHHSIGLIRHKPCDCFRRFTQFSGLWPARELSSMLLGYQQEGCIVSSPPGAGNTMGKVRGRRWWNRGGGGKPCREGSVMGALRLQEGMDLTGMFKVLFPIFAASPPCCLLFSFLHCRSGGLCRTKGIKGQDSAINLTIFLKDVDCF